MLREIERDVLHDVHIGARNRTTATAATLVLGCAAVFGGWSSVRLARDGLNGDWLSVIATAVFTLACAGSVGALLRKRFRWGCVALYLAALALVTGLAAVWSQQTGVGGLAWWALLGGAAASALALSWATVLTAPIHRSQPDMRAADETGWFSR